MAGWPTDRDVLAIRVQDQLAELETVRACLKDPRVQRVSGQVLGDRLDQLLDNAGRDLNRQLSARRSTDGGWALLENAAAASARLKREALALVLGALLRDAGLDNGIQEIATHLFGELSARTGVEARVVASVGDTEFLDRTLEMARTRFPDTTVWGLPVLAHEFGHYVARVLPHADPDLRRQVWPLAELLAEEADADSELLADLQQTSPRDLSRRAVAHLNEVFADVYATYAWGACYPLAAIVLRARLASTDGGSPTSSTETHPSWARRVQVMCEALRAMSDLTREPQHRLMADGQVEPLWRRLAAGVAVEDPLLASARGQARRMVQALLDHAPGRLRTNDEGQLGQLEALLTSTSAIQPSSLPPRTDLFHVVAAAWGWRVGHWTADPGEVRRISRRALSLCYSTTT